RLALLLLPPRPKAIFLAGPGIFRPDANEIGRELKALCALHGFEGLWPGDENSGSSQMLFIMIRDMLRRSAAIIADITPFRGPHMEPGTAFAIGLAYQAGIPIFGYSTVADLDRSAVDGERVRGLIERVWTSDYAPGTDGYYAVGEDGCWRDKDGNLVENFGLVENLMVARAMRSISISAVEAVICCVEYFESAAKRAGQAYAS
ncbi:MAG: nucleoside 2-deoxyribosyltransferase, partial [Xanthobacteraceae bacterium]